jgi:opacity protein-like surface antigen
MHRIVTTAAAVCALLAAAPVRAQEAAQDTAPRTSLQKGAWSLAFDLPIAVGGSSRLGAWKMVGARTNLGVSLEVQTRDADGRRDSATANEQYHAVELGVEARRYLSPADEVTPFATAGVFGFIGRRAQEAGATRGETSYRGAAVHAGAGVEWFPVRRVSLAGHTGVRLNVYDGEITARHNDVETEGEDSAIDFTTFTSRLSLQIYF